MKFRFAPKTRTLVIAVAIVALAIGGGMELQNRQLRDQHAWYEADQIARAERHERELAVCRSHSDDDPDDPYDEDRSGNNLEGLWTDFASWEEEASWHEDYAARYRKASALHANLKRKYQRRLLIP